MIHPYFDLSGSDARGLLYGLMEVDKIQLRENPSMPSMRELVQTGGVKYRRADPEEHWKSYKEMVDEFKGNGVSHADCEDIATAIAAEDQVRYGVKSLPYAYAPREGLFHVVTAVPQDQFGGIPHHSWPSAQYAPEIVGYVLQDPSVAAGMGSFGGLPAKEVSAMYGAHGYGAAGRHMYGAQDRGPRRGFFEKLGLPKGSAWEEARGAVKGAAEGVGLKRGLGKELGSQIPELLGLPSIGGKKKGEAAAVSALREGAATEARAAAREEAEPDDDADLLEGLEDEEFGRMWFEDDPDLYPLAGDDVFGYEPEDWVGSTAWQADQVANRVADDMFGAVDDDVYTMGIFHGSLRPSIEDANEGVQVRGAGGSFYDPDDDYGFDEEDEDFGAFWHSKEKRAKLKRKRARKAAAKGRTNRAARIRGRASRLESKAGISHPGERDEEAPLATYDDMASDEDFGAFWHKKAKRKEIVFNKLKKLKSKGKEDTKRWDRLVARYVKLGGDEDDIDELDEKMGFQMVSSEHLFGGMYGADDDDLIYDAEMDELEDLDIELEAEGF